MRKIFTILSVLVVAAMALATNSTSVKTNAQSGNSHSKVTITEEFIFPNDCTNELLDVSDTTVVTCHDQVRADGTFNEKCEVTQDITAVGETTGIVWHGNATFKDELIATDDCNFSFSNLGKVKLLSAGNTPNIILTFDDEIRMEDCALTADDHFFSSDCRGTGKP
ncbi:MAG TPA: hypothetical protein VN696_13070 [Pyrinomonadaceae bacterium]|nr:hypothetical protein [Pyrinomonadaceae bacterium]